MPRTTEKPDRLQTGILITLVILVPLGAGMWLAIANWYHLFPH